MSNRSLRGNRDFQLLWIGQTLSAFGSFASFVTLPLLVLAMTGSSTRAGLVGFAMSASAMVASLPGGVLVDRCNRRAVMLVCNLVRGGAMAVLAVAVAADKAPLPLVLIMAAVNGGMGSLFAPAEVAALQRIVTAEQLPSALAANQARAAAAALGGPSLGGFLFGLSRGLPFVLDALSYAASFLCVLFIRTPLDVRRTGREKVGWSDLVLGLKFLWGHPFLRSVMATDVVLNFAFSGILLAVIVAGVEQGSSGLSIGMVIGLAGAGTLIGAVLAPKVQTLVSPRQTILAICWTTAALIPLMALSLSLPMLGAILAACSVLAPIESVVVSGSRILLTPDDLQGRAQSASGLASMSATPLGPLVAGFLLDHVHAPLTFLVFGGVLAALAILSTTSRGLRQLPETQAIPVPETSATPAHRPLQPDASAALVAPETKGGRRRR